MRPSEAGPFFVWPVYVCVCALFIYVCRNLYVMPSLLALSVVYLVLGDGLPDTCEVGVEATLKGSHQLHTSLSHTQPHKHTQRSQPRGVVCLREASCLHDSSGVLSLSLGGGPFLPPLSV